MALDLQSEPSRDPIRTDVTPNLSADTESPITGGESRRSAMRLQKSESLSSSAPPKPQEISGASVAIAAPLRGAEFLAVFSHEVRSALAAIHNAAQLLRMQRADSSVALKAGALIERQVGRLRRLIDDISNISRVRGDELSLKLERIDLNVVAKRAIDTLAFDLEARGHKFAVSFPSQPVWLRGDAGRIEQVLVNLLGNAAKYTDPGGNISLSLHATVEHAVVCVRDTGIGIAADDLPRIFDLYMQADPASHRAEAGLGIGLALVRSLVQLHGGSVTAASGGLGTGSVFTVSLPLASE